MKKEVRIEGTAFTRRRKVIERTETPAEFLEGLREIARRSKDPWAAHHAEVEWARRALEMELEGKPSEHSFKPHEDSGWYLERLVMLGKIVQHHIDRGAASWAAHEAALFGETWSELQLKLAREELFLLGAKTAEERSRGGGWNRKATAEQKIASYRRHRAAGHNKTDATYLAAKELGVAESNIRAARKAAGASD